MREVRWKFALVLAVSFAVGCRADQRSPVETEDAEAVSSTHAAAVQEPLFTLIPVPVLTGEQQRRLSAIRGRPGVSEVQVARLAGAPAALLRRGSAVAFNVSPQARFVAVGETVSQRAPNDVSWAGPLREETGWSQLVLTGKGVTGTLRTGTELYQFEPIGGGLQAISRVDVSGLPPEHPAGNSTGALREAIGTAARGSVAPTAPMMQTGSGSTRIDVLVVYTQAVVSAHADVAGLIQLAIDETNTSYSNSGIGANMVKAYSAQVTYTEAGRSFTQHVDALEGTSDGSMDIVHTWRNTYSADVVVLLVDDSEACGEASVILADQSTAFAAVDYSCATGNYSFGHEVGHLQGARHDRAVDPTNTPFQYGHGYVDPNGTWRTIMAYSNACGGCTRVQYWSSPLVTYPPTGQVMGTAAYEDNARVLNETKATFAEFRTPPVSVTISGPTTASGYSPSTWEAMPSGGNGTFTYSWSIQCYGSGQRQYIGTSKTITFVPRYYCSYGSSIQLKVEVGSGSQQGSAITTPGIY